MPPRYAAKKDKVHNPIQEALEQVGFIVKDTSRMGEDFPDLVVKHPARPEIGVRLVELKSKGGKLSKGQQEFKDEWEDSVLVAYTLEDVLAFYGFL